MHAHRPILHGLAASPGTFSEPDDSQVLAETSAAAQSLVADVAAGLHQQGVVDIRTDVIGGAAAEIILSVAKTRGISLIVIDARGVSRWKGLLLGNVGLPVTQRATCRVLVVK